MMEIFYHWNIWRWRTGSSNRRCSNIQKIQSLATKVLWTQKENRTESDFPSEKWKKIRWLPDDYHGVHMLHKCKAQGRHKQNKKVGVGLSIFSLLSGQVGVYLLLVPFILFSKYIDFYETSQVNITRKSSFVNSSFRWNF